MRFHIIDKVTWKDPIDYVAGKVSHVIGIMFKAKGQKLYWYYTYKKKSFVLRFFAWFSATTYEVHICVQFKTASRIRS